MIARLAGGPVPRREVLLLLAAIAGGILLRLAYVVVTKDHVIAGDEVEYDIEAKLAVAGNWLWSSSPYGVPHPTMMKAPGYPLFVSATYTVLGTDPDRTFALQAVLFTPPTLGLTWLLGRRLFGPAVGVAAACVMAVYPNAWQFDVRLYSEGLAQPATLAALVLILTTATFGPRRAALVGVVIGAGLLIRPSSLFLFAGLGLLLLAGYGLRRAVGWTAVAVLAAALVVVPWTIRNYAVVDSDHIVPISIQDAAAFGSFNEDARNDRRLPYKWRPNTSSVADLFAPGAPQLSEGALRAELNSRVRDHIREHPDAIPRAFFHNGLSRLWDIRPTAQILDDTAFEGRTRSVTAVGLALYYPLLALALIGLALLWRAGRRPVVLGVIGVALAASVVYIPDAGTRYRVPLEGLIVVLACSTVVPVIAARRARPRRPATSRARRPPR